MHRALSMGSADSSITMHGLSLWALHEVGSVALQVLVLEHHNDFSDSKFWADLCG